MASGSGFGGQDPAWKYVIPVDGNKFGTTCKFCNSTFQSGGITRLKSHLAGYDRHKSVKKCNSVPKEIKNEIIAWMKKKETIKQQKAAIADDIRDELQSNYLNKQPSLFDEYDEDEEEDEDEEDDGYAYPSDMHPQERAAFRTAVRASNVERDKKSWFTGSNRFSTTWSGGSSNQQDQKFQRSKSVRNPLPNPPVDMPSKDNRAKQRSLKAMLKGSRERVGKAISRFFIFDSVAANKAASPHFKNMLVEVARAGEGAHYPTPYEIHGPYLKREYTDMKTYVESHRQTWEMFGCTIMCDGWTSPTKLAIINFMVYSKGATVFLKSVDASRMKKSAEYIYGILNEIIQDVGPNNVVQIVTDNAAAFKKAGRDLMKYIRYIGSCVLSIALI